MAGRTIAPLVNHELVRRVRNSLYVADAVPRSDSVASLDELCLFVAMVVVFGDELQVDPTVPQAVADETQTAGDNLGVRVRDILRPDARQIAEDAATGGALLLASRIDSGRARRLALPPARSEEPDRQWSSLLEQHRDLLRKLDRSDDHDDRAAWLCQPWADRLWGNKLLAAIVGDVGAGDDGRDCDLLRQYRDGFERRLADDGRAAAFWYVSDLIGQFRLGYLGAAAVRGRGMFLSAASVDAAAQRIAAFDRIVLRLLQRHGVDLSDERNPIADVIVNHALTAAAVRAVLDPIFDPAHPLTLIDAARKQRDPTLRRAVTEAQRVSKGDEFDQVWVDGFVDDTARFMSRSRTKRDRFVDYVVAEVPATAGAVAVSPWLAIPLRALSTGASGRRRRARTRAAVATLATDTMERGSLERVRNKLAALPLRT